MATRYEKPRTFGGAASKRPDGISLGPLRQRLTNAFRAGEQDDQHADQSMPPALSPERDLGDIPPRFRIVRQGYDCVAVDAYIDELERELAEADRELAELQSRAPAPDEVQTELKRVGEQTSAVLIAAHEQQEEILRAAREEADRRISEATVRASTLTAESEAGLRELEAKKEAIQRQRDRLLDEVRSVSRELAALADPTHEKIPPQE